MPLILRGKHSTPAATKSGCRENGIASVVAAVKGESIVKMFCRCSVAQAPQIIKEPLPGSFAKTDRTGAPKCILLGERPKSGSKRTRQRSPAKNG